MKIIMSRVEPPGASFLKLWHIKLLVGLWKHRVLHCFFFLFHYKIPTEKFYRSKNFCVFEGILASCLQSQTTTLMWFSWEMFWFNLTIFMFVSLSPRFPSNGMKICLPHDESFCEVIWNEWSDLLAFVMCARRALVSWGVDN